MTHNDTFDLTGDGKVNSADADYLVRNLLGTNYGDTDLDSDVDTSDLTKAIMNFTGAGGSGKSWSGGDTDGDNDVDTSDLTKAIINFTGAAAAADSSGAVVSDERDGEILVTAAEVVIGSSEVAEAGQRENSGKRAAVALTAVDTLYQWYGDRSRGTGVPPMPFRLW